MRKAPRKILLAIGCAVTLGGCGEIGFKRGGGASDFAAAQQRCGAAGDAGYAGCMHAAGWTTVSPDAPQAASTPPPAGQPAPSPPAAASRIVQSWWKLGAGAGDLAADKAACGDEAAPSFLGCMKSHGWTSLTDRPPG